MCRRRREESPYQITASLTRLLRTVPRPFDDDVNASLVLRNHVGGQDTAPEDVRVNYRATANDTAGIQHGVAADFHAVAEQSAEFAQAGVKWLAIQLELDVAGEHFEIGDFHAGAQMRLVAEDGVADVIVVRRLGVVEQKRIFQFGRIAHHAVVADDDIFAEVGVVANFAVFADDGRAFDHHAVLQDRAFADEHLFADVRPAFALVAQFRFQIGGEIPLNFFQRLPGKFAAVKNGGVFGLVEVKQVGWFEHAVKVAKQPLRESVIFGGHRPPLQLKARFQKDISPCLYTNRRGARRVGGALIQVR